MTPDRPQHQDRRRARSFGLAAISYDRCRPRYPQHAVDFVLEFADGGLVVDVGAGTGIFTRQLAERGLDVLAVEPDPAMAAVAQGHGVRVKVAAFEEWDPGGRKPAVVVFANSWHWVDRATALSRIQDTLAPRGHLVLIWHALRPAGPIADRIDDVYRRAELPDAQPAPTSPDTSYLTEAGFTVATHTHLVESRWSTADWLDQQFTISTHLVLTPTRAQQLRRNLVDTIGEGGVPITEHTYVVAATPNR